MADLSVTRNDDASCYEIRSDGELAGFAEYRHKNGEIQFTHTEVDPAFRGGGVAGTLASEALTDAAASGETLVPYCPFIEKYLRTHEVAGAVVRWPEHRE